MAIKTIGHIGDVHWRNYSRHVEYNAVKDNFIYQLERLKLDRLVIAGDIVHSRNQLTPELVEEVSVFLRQCAKYVGKVIVIAGNHDIVEQNKERMDALTPIINNLNNSNIVYYKDSGVYVDENVSWVVYSLYQNHETPRELYGLGNSDKTIKIGLYHGIINGATNNMGFTFLHGADVEKFEHCDIVLCGDIHKRQVLYTKNGTPVIYVGSFIQQDYYETISERGYNIVKIGENNEVTHEFNDIINPVKYLRFTITDFSDIQNNNETLSNA